MGATEKKLALQRTLQERIFAVVKREKDNAAAEKQLDEVLNQELAKLDDEDKKNLSDLKAIATSQTRQVLSPWFRFFLAYDPRPALKKVKCPVLAINGEKDVQVPAKENLESIALALKAGGNPDYTIKELPKLNHLLQTCQTGSLTEYGTIQETIAPSALELISDWILKHTAGQGAGGK